MIQKEVLLKYIGRIEHNLSCIQVHKDNVEMILEKMREYIG